MEERKAVMASESSAVPGSPAWWADRPAAPAAGRRGRPPMNVDRIIDMALKLVDEVGVQALTLRMLADALDSGTATLYRHFAGKDELLAYVVDRILGEVRVTPESVDGLSWREAVEIGAETFYDTLRRHPNALPLLVAQVPVGPNGLANRERILRLLNGFGFPVALAARAFTAIGHYVVGFAIQQHGPGSPGSGDESQLLDYYRALDPHTYPATAAAADDLTNVPLQEEFRFGLRLLLDGLEHARQSAGDTPA
ncbi:TetR/AcrR family transcriptional regulator [Streptomyces sp. NPDC050848]|uniref:TetR/AcrR family transcriptional regulator n=1 Tax=Streptomyces sp. NPDC050848 TaxID=3155791 RepID=UPI0033EEA140